MGMILPESGSHRPDHALNAYTTCPSCGSGTLEIFYEQKAIPIDSCRLLSSRAEAREFPRGVLRLSFCRSCGFIWNTAFDPSVQDSSASYQEIQRFSPRFERYVRRVAQRLIGKYKLHGKSLFEIGCGQGDFLSLMCQLGDNHGIGIDPNFVEKKTEAKANRRISIVKDYFSESHRRLIGDFVICRHTLEHIQPVRDFLCILRRSLKDRFDVTVFFEVPDSTRILREGAFWDMYYEHCSYFTCGSLARLFRRVGFEVLELALDFENQYILLEGRPMNTIRQAPLKLEEQPAEMAQVVKNLQDNIRDEIANWSKILKPVRNEGRRAVLWGSGAKSAAFLNVLRMGDKIDYIVNINPHQQGKYVVGTGQKIMPPEFLKDYKPDFIVCLNRIYLTEISERLEALGVVADVLTI
jgi:hypothetical protein